MGIQITNDEILRLGMSPEELRIEIALHLYNIGKMSMGQARNFANLDQLAFQNEMSKRNIYVKYSIEELEEDLTTVKDIEQLYDQK